MLINDVNETLKTLLTLAFHQMLETTATPSSKSAVLPKVNIDITFETPDATFQNKLQHPTLNLFLYDLRENLELRASERMHLVTQDPLPSKPANGVKYSGALYQDPVQVELSYLVTAWCQASPKKERDENDLLNIAMKTFLQNQQIPESALKGSLQSLTTLPRGYTLRPAYLHSVSEFWSSMGIPKTMFNYSITVAYEALKPEETTLITHTHPSKDSSNSESG